MQWGHTDGYIGSSQGRGNPREVATGEWGRQVGHGHGHDRTRGAEDRAQTNKCPANKVQTRISTR